MADLILLDYPNRVKILAYIEYRLQDPDWDDVDNRWDISRNIRDWSYNLQSLISRGGSRQRSSSRYEAHNIWNYIPLQQRVIENESLVETVYDVMNGDIYCNQNNSPTPTHQEDPAIIAITANLSKQELGLLILQLQKKHSEMK